MPKEQIFIGINEQETRLKMKLSSLGIDTVVWDFDGTLIDTKALYDQAIIASISLLAFGKDISCLVEDERRETEELKSRYFCDNGIVWQLRPEMGINPSIMETSIRILAKILQPNDRVGGNYERITEAAVERIMRIYGKDIPRLFPGAMETISTLDQAVKQSFLATHALEEWTWDKIYATGLVGRFKRVTCFSIDRPKSEQWDDLFFKNLHLDPHSVLSIGDNRQADIDRPAQLGAWAIWVNRGGSFGSYGLENGKVSTPPLQDRVFQVRNLDEIVQRILDI